MYVKKTYYCLLLCLGVSSFLLTTLNIKNIYAQELEDFPAPGKMVHVSKTHEPVMMKGLILDPDNPFHFDFLVDSGDKSLNKVEVEPEAEKLIRYFLTSLTVPHKDIWVNLSPYEKDRIIPESFSLTEMGRDLLAQDYLLKQLTATLIYPEENIGESFWKQVYKKAVKEYGTMNIPIETFNKVWIVPGKAEVFVEDNIVFITDANLKVMHEDDYIAASENKYTKVGKTTSSISTQVLRETIIPELEHEINHGENFKQLRQIYYSMILAIWYKRNLEQNIINKVYSDENKVSGVDFVEFDTKHEIYKRYIEAFKKGVFKYIREDYDLVSGEMTPRKYFSGGFDARLLTISETGNSSPVSEVLKEGGVFKVASLLRPSHNPLARLERLLKRTDSGELKNVLGINEGASQQEALTAISKYLLENGLAEKDEREGVDADEKNKIVVLKIKDELKDSGDFKLAKLIYEFVVSDENNEYASAVNLPTEQQGYLGGKWLVLGFKSDLEDLEGNDSRDLEHELMEVSYRQLGIDWVTAHNIVVGITGYGQRIDEEVGAMLLANDDVIGAGKKKKKKKDKKSAQQKRAERESFNEWSHSIRKIMDDSVGKKGDIAFSGYTYKMVALSSKTLFDVPRSYEVSKDMSNRDVFHNILNLEPDNIEKIANGAKTGLFNKGFFLLLNPSKYINLNNIYIDSKTGLLKPDTPTPNGGTVGNRKIYTGLSGMNKVGFYVRFKDLQKQEVEIVLIGQTAQGRVIARVLQWVESEGTYIVLHPHLLASLTQEIAANDTLGQHERISSESNISFVKRDGNRVVYKVVDYIYSKPVDRLVQNVRAYSAWIIDEDSVSIHNVSKSIDNALITMSVYGLFTFKINDLDAEGLLFKHILSISKDNAAKFFHRSHDIDHKLGSMMNINDFYDSEKGTIINFPTPHREFFSPVPVGVRRAKHVYCEIMFLDENKEFIDIELKFDNPESKDGDIPFLYMRWVEANKKYYLINQKVFEEHPELTNSQVYFEEVRGRFKIFSVTDGARNFLGSLKGGTFAKYVVWDDALGFIAMEDVPVGDTTDELRDEIKANLIAKFEVEEHIHKTLQAKLMAAQLGIPLVNLLWATMPEVLFAKYDSEKLYELLMASVTQKILEASQEDYFHSKEPRKVYSEEPVQLNVGLDDLQDERLDIAKASTFDIYKFYELMRIYNEYSAAGGTSSIEDIEAGLKERSTELQETNPLLVEVIDDILADFQEARILRDRLPVNIQGVLQPYQYLVLNNIIKRKGVIFTEKVQKQRTLLAFSAFLLSDEKELLVVAPTRSRIERWYREIIRYSPQAIEVVPLSPFSKKVDAENSDVSLKSFRSNEGTIEKDQIDAVGVEWTEIYRILVNENELADPVDDNKIVLKTNIIDIRGALEEALAEDFQKVWSVLQESRDFYLFAKESPEQDKKRIILITSSQLQEFRKNNSADVNTDVIVLEDSHTLKDDNFSTQAVIGNDQIQMIGAEYKLGLTNTVIKTAASDLLFVLKYLALGRDGIERSQEDKFILGFSNKHSFAAFFRTMDFESTSKLRAFLQQRIISFSYDIGDLDATQIVSLDRENRTMKVGKETTTLSDNPFAYQEQSRLYDNILYTPASFQNSETGMADPRRQYRDLELVEQHPANFGPIGHSIKFDAAAALTIEEFKQGRSVLVLTKFKSVTSVLAEYLAFNINEFSDFNVDEVPYIHGSTSDKEKVEVISAFQSADGPQVIVISSGTQKIPLDIDRVDTIIHMGPEYTIENYTFFHDLVRYGKEGTSKPKDIKIMLLQTEHTRAPVGAIGWTRLRRRDTLESMFAAGNLSKPVLNLFQGQHEDDLVQTIKNARAQEKKPKQLPPSSPVQSYAGVNFSPELFRLSEYGRKMELHRKYDLSEFQKVAIDSMFATIVDISPVSMEEFSFVE